MNDTGTYFVRCRCGGRHPLATDTMPCHYCDTPTVDFHRVCAGCRGAEALEFFADRALAVVAEANP